MVAVGVVGVVGDVVVVPTMRDRSELLLGRAIDIRSADAAVVSCFCARHRSLHESASIMRRNETAGENMSCRDKQQRERERDLFFLLQNSFRTQFSLPFFSFFRSVSLYLSSDKDLFSLWTFVTERSRDRRARIVHCSTNLHARRRTREKMLSSSSTMLAPRPIVALAPRSAMITLKASRRSRYVF